MTVSLLVKKTSLRPEFWIRPSRNELYEFYNYSIPLTLTDLGHLFYKRVDILMVGFFLMEADVGIYQIAIFIAGVLTLPLGAFNQHFPPVASRLYSNGEISELNSLYKRVTRWTLTLGIPPALVALIYSNQILAIFGPKFPEGSMVLVIFTLGQLTNLAVGPSGHLLMMMDHQYISLMNKLILGLLNIILNYILILELGLVGAALATGSVLAFINIIRLMEVWYTERLVPYSWSIWKPLLSGIITGLTMYSFSIIFSGYESLLIGSSIGSLTFISSLIIFGIEADDRAFFQEIIL